VHQISTAGSEIRGEWKPEEDARISKLRSEGSSWRDITIQCPGRCYDQVMNRYKDHLDPSVLKTPWTAPEESILIQEQSRVGNSWRQISQLLPGRSTNQVKNRWYQIQRRSGLGKQSKSYSVKETSNNKVHDDHADSAVITTPWTEIEDNILIQEQSRLGNRWTQISKILPFPTPS
jgi:hypothetical protein